MVRLTAGLLVVLALAGGQTNAQTNRDYYNGRLRASPHEVQAFDTSGCHITITYGRPSKKGRAIWGALVPWDRWWMPGADEATILETSRTVAFDGLSIPAGGHSLYFWPADAESSLIVNDETGQFHTVYHPDRDLGRIKMALTKRSTPVEQLTFEVEQKPDGGVLKLIWDDREYAAAFVTPKVF